MKTIIATREFIRGSGRPTLRLEVFQPVAAPGQNGWSCEFCVLSGDAIILQDEAIGTDAMQALASAIAGLRWQFDQGPLIGELNEEESWFRDSTRSSGLPLYLPQGFGPEFDLRLRLLVEGEIQARLREREVVSSRVLLGQKESESQD